MDSSFSYKRHVALDNIELFSSENETDYFPFHFHDYYCISLITKGTEHLETLQGSHYAMSGSISVTQAHEIHKNQSTDSSGYSYKTCYVNPDLLNYYGQGKKISQLERVIGDPQLIHSFSQLFDDQTFNADHFQNALTRLSTYAVAGAPEQTTSFDLIDELTDTVPYQPISMDWLSRQFCMSKFHFIRVFKREKGITPQAYILVRRLKNAKEMLLNGEDVKTVAFLHGFYDVAHLNTAFKRFFGITLSMIKKSNIIQFGE
jgi:AraC-like DNA-binding protein